MSLLAPLYFAGALAIGLPILFHLIRRRPKGEVEFSSLMFLRPTPPRLTRKSRLDNIPLLLIRALALILLAAAFARPFLRSTAQSDTDIPTRRMVLVIDTSASMQRSGLWRQALDKAGDVIDDLQPADQIAIVTYDSSPKTLLGFDQSSRFTGEQLKSTAKKLLSDVSPSWHPTDTGRAISYAADLAVTYEPEDSTLDGDQTENVASRLAGPAHMILISDMQAGSQIESLQVYAWPDQIRLDIEKVVAKEKTNASAQILVGGPEQSADDKDRVRVRVANAADSSNSHFSIAWSEATGAAAVELPVQVPPGESRVLRMPAPGPSVTSLVLSGDDQSFDNVRYLVSPQPESLSLIHLGAAAAEPRDSLLYYLRRVPLSNARRDVSVDSLAPGELTATPDPKKVPLVVVDDAISSDIAQRLKNYVSQGGRVLYVLVGSDRDRGTSLQAMTESGQNLVIEEAIVDDYAMLSQIDFAHPVFAPMADPQFNDFTKIRVWSHRKIGGLDESWKVLARFDDGDPALIEQTIGTGRLWVLATGWQPAESQLALSTKFIPLVFSLFDTSGGSGTGDRYTLGQVIDMAPSPMATITNPAGSAQKFQSADDLEIIDQPGIYQYSDGETTRTFAVNLNELESRTEALGDAELERFGVTLGSQLSTSQSIAQQRQLRDVELEGRQKLWQWLLVAGLALLALETLWGGWLSRARPQAIETGLET